MKIEKSATVGEAIDIWITQCGPQFVDEGRQTRERLQVCKRHLGDLAVSSFDQAAVEAYVSKRLSDGVKASTIRRELSFVLRALRWSGVVAEERLPNIRFLPVRSTARQRVVTEQELRKLLRAARQHRELELFIRLALATGARISALIELTWDRIDFERAEIDLRAPHPREHRRKHRATIPLSEHLRPVLKAAREHTPTAKLVFSIGADPMRAAFERAVKRAGLSKDITPHVLRHTAASMLLRSLPLTVASRMIGHRATRTTDEVYGHLCTTDLVPAADLLARAAVGDEASLARTTITLLDFEFPAEMISGRASPLGWPVRRKTSNEI